MNRAPIALAMDTTDLDTVASWTRAVASEISTIKVGLELFVRHGAKAVEIVRGIAPEMDLFLDLKLHDIPNTVRGATAAVAELAPKYLTVHALGGAEMIAAAAAAAPDAAIAAVTILTSHSEADLGSLGIRGPISERVFALASMAVSAGARALVCSPHEVRALRDLVGDAVDLITPGVRPPGADHGDQVRTATPQDAIASGATLLVIGRPITGAYQTGGESGMRAAAAAISAMTARTQ